jgi:Subtilase family
MNNFHAKAAGRVPQPRFALPNKPSGRSSRTRTTGRRFKSLVLSKSLVLGTLSIVTLVGCGGGTGDITGNPTPTPATTPTPGTTPTPNPNPTPAGTRSIVLVRPQIGTTIETLLRRHGGELIERVSGKNIYAISIENSRRDDLGRDTEALSTEDNDPLSAPEPVVGDPFHYATDFRSEVDPAFDASLRASVDAPPSVFGRGRSTGSPVIVAVLDTGITRTHPALQGHLLPGYNAITGTSDDADISDGTHNRGVGHGTMVAGVIARLAPDAKILPIRVLNGDGIGSVLSVTKGIEYALSQGARVINISASISRSSGALDDVFEDLIEKKAVLVAAAGNDNSNRGPYPAAASHVLGVAAVESNRTKSAYSNYGPWVSVSAPGTGMESSWWQGGYAHWSGTSFATPCVSAEAAYILCNYPNLRPQDVEDCIKRSAVSVDDANPSYRGQLGKGLIQFRAALALAAKK